MKYPVFEPILTNFKSPYEFKLANSKMMAKSAKSAFTGTLKRDEE
jgi:hypothetical protein